MKLHANSERVSCVHSAELAKQLDQPKNWPKKKHKH